MVDYRSPALGTQHSSMMSISEFKENHSVSIAGRLMSRRIQGKASFAEIQDSVGKIQLYFNRDEICPNGDKSMYLNTPL